MAAKKAERFPDEVFLDNALRSGRAVEKQVGLRGLVADFNRFQARVLHLDMDHVRYLQAALKQSGRLTPVVVFYNPSTKQHVLADGFHRHDAYKREGIANIHAYVIEGTDDDVLHYATMCNRRRGLGRTKEDIKKAVEMLLSNKNWFNRADNWISSHVGIPSPTVSRYRNTFCVQNGVPRPQKVEWIDGRVGPYDSRRKPGEKPKVNEHDGRFQVTYNRTIIRSSDKAEVQKTLDDIISSEVRNGLGRGVLSASGIRQFFFSRGFSAEYVSLSDIGISDQRCLLGVLISGQYIVSGAFIEKRDQLNPVSLAMAESQILCRKHDCTLTPVVLCDTSKVPAPVIEIIESIGVRVVTPLELIDILSSSRGTT